MRNKRTTEPALELLTVIITITALVLVVMFFSSCGGGGKATSRKPQASGGQVTSPTPPPPAPVPPPDTTTNYKPETPNFPPPPATEIPNPDPDEEPAPQLLYASLRTAYPYPDALNVQAYGMLPSNTAEENSAFMDSLLASIPEGGVKSIYIPAGNYQFARPITIFRRPINLFGDNGTIWGASTKLYFPYNSTGIRIDRGGQSIQETIIEKICLIGAGGDGSQGNGIHTNARVKLRHVTAKGFSQNGFLIHANMPEGGDASGSSIEFCHSLENGHDGFFAGRTDANVITFLGCDARDNGRNGFSDDSFLGNNFISCMAHYNKAGDYYVRDKGNARSFFDGCYSEGGNVPSQLGPHSTVRGGMWGSGYTQ